MARRRHKRTVHQRGGKFPGMMKRSMMKRGKRKKVNQKGGFLLTLASILTPIIAGAAFEAVKANNK